MPLLIKMGGRPGPVEIFGNIGYTIGGGVTVGGTLGFHVGPGVAFGEFLASVEGSSGSFTTVVGYKVGLVDKK
jgi:hypothetical protein